MQNNFQNFRKISAPTDFHTSGNDNVERRLQTIFIFLEKIPRIILRIHQKKSLPKFRKNKKNHFRYRARQSVPIVSIAQNTSRDSWAANSLWFRSGSVRDFSYIFGPASMSGPSSSDRFRFSGPVLGLGQRIPDHKFGLNLRPLFVKKRVTSSQFRFIRNDAHGFDYTKHALIRSIIFK